MVGIWIPDKLGNQMIKSSLKQWGLEYRTWNTKRHWKQDHSQSRHSCPGFNYFWQNVGYFSGFWMVWLLDFISLSNSRPFANQPLFGIQTASWFHILIVFGSLLYSYDKLILTCTNFRSCLPPCPSSCCCRQQKRNRTTSAVFSHLSSGFVQHIFHIFVWSRIGWDRYALSRVGPKHQNKSAEMIFLQQRLNITRAPKWR